MGCRTRDFNQRVFTNEYLAQTLTVCIEGGMYPLGTCSFGVGGAELAELADGVRGDGDETARGEGWPRGGLNPPDRVSQRHISMSYRLARV